MGNEMIQISGLNLSLKSLEIFKNLSLTCQKGKIIGIIGANGAGKSVLFKVIAGLYQPNSGQVIVDGVDITRERRVPAELGALIEEPGFIPQYTGFRNLQYLASIRGKISTDDIENALKTVGLEQAKNVKVSRYSLGMKKKLGIAQAIMEKPNLLLLDEPMNALDAESIQMMRNLFKNLSEENGTTILLASHNQEDIDILCDQVYKIENGQCYHIR